MPAPSEDSSTPHRTSYTLPDEETSSVPFAYGQGVAVAIGLSLVMGVSSELMYIEVCHVTVPCGVDMSGLLMTVDGPSIDCSTPPTSKALFDDLRDCDPDLR